MLALFIIGFILLSVWLGAKVLYIVLIVGLLGLPWVAKFARFFVMVYRDLFRAVRGDKEFREFGVTIYCGRQGAGKTMSIVEYLERMRRQYPKAKIITNFGYKYEDFALDSWQDLIQYRNGVDGIIFAIDEIQNEYDSTKWKAFPEALLREITQQRKQRIKIVMSSQVYTRVVKQIREQCFEVVECSCWLGRWVFQRAYDAEDYNSIIDRPEVKMKLPRLWRHNFLQSDKLREMFDSYAKVEKIASLKMLPRNERVG